MPQRSWLARPLVLFALLLAGLAPAQLPAQAAAPQAPPPPPGAPSGDGPSYFPPFVPTCGTSQYNNGALDGQLIHDFSTITSTLSVPSLSGALWAVAVNTVITHTFNADLDIHLVSPAGTIVTLSANNGGGHPGNVFSGTTWLDQAALATGNGEPVTDYHFTPGTLAPLLNPQEPLSVLQGQPAAGNWSLVIHDGAGGDGGQLLSWGLELITFRANPYITTTTVFADNSVQPISDNGTVVRNLTVAGVDSSIGGISVSTVLTHPQPGSLHVYLVSPAGISITLSTGNGLSNTNALAGTVWSDKAGLSNPPGAVTENTFAPNVVESPLAPEEALNELDGQPANGTWHVVVQDTAVDAKTGQLGPVKLSLQTLKCPPDLAPGVSTVAGAPRLVRPITVTLTASNQGDDATGIVLTGTLPATLLIQSVSAPNWACLPLPPGSPGGTIQCTRASLAAETSANVSVLVTAPPLPQSVPVTVTLGLAPTEVISGNNTVHQTVSFFAHSANGNPWDVVNSDGELIDGGQDAFDGWGALRMAVYNNSGNQIATNYPSGLGLVFGAGHRWDTSTPYSLANISVSRSLFGPAGADWLRYVDTFHNSALVSQTVIAAWGGNLGSDQSTATAASSAASSTVIDSSDRWAVTEQLNTPGGPAIDAVVGYAFRSNADTSYLGPTNFEGADITTTWPITHNDLLAHTFRFNLTPGATARLAYFVYRGVSENYPGPQDCLYYGGCTTPANGTQVTLVKNAVISLQANPYFCDLSQAERDSLVNWPNIVDHCSFVPIVRR